MQPRRWLARLLAFLKSRSGGRESDTDYNGVLSYTSEYHALLIGLGAGIVAGYLNQPPILVGVISVALGLKGAKRLAGPLDGRYVVEELTSEPWYGVGGALVGWVAAAVYWGGSLLP